MLSQLELSMILVLTAFGSLTPKETDHSQSWQLIRNIIYSMITTLWPKPNSITIIASKPISQIIRAILFSFSKAWIILSFLSILASKAYLGLVHSLITDSKLNIKVMVASRKLWISTSLRRLLNWSTWTWKDIQYSHT
jgi:hypothetical protein